MNKKQSIAAVAEKSGVSVKDVEKVMAGFQSVVGEAVAADDKVDLGFVKFSRKDKPASTGRNPKTKEPIQIAARSVVLVKVVPSFNEATFAPKA